MVHAIRRSGPDSSLTHVDLSCNQLGDEGLERLASALKKSVPSIRALYLSFSLLSDRGIGCLAKGLMLRPLSFGPHPLERLDLGGNAGITDRGVKDVGAALKGGRLGNLRELVLSNISMTDGASLCSPLCSNHCAHSCARFAVCCNPVRRASPYLVLFRWCWVLVTCC